MTVENIETIQNMIAALNQLEVKGKQNHVIIVACLNDLENMLHGRKEETNVNLNPKS